MSFSRFDFRLIFNTFFFSSTLPFRLLFIRWFRSFARFLVLALNFSIIASTLHLCSYFFSLFVPSFPYFAHFLFLFPFLSPSTQCNLNLYVEKVGWFIPQGIFSIQGKLGCICTICSSPPSYLIVTGAKTVATEGREGGGAAPAPEALVGSCVV